jgi:hypothetical protein
MELLPPWNSDCVLLCCTRIQEQAKLVFSDPTGSDSLILGNGLLRSFDGMRVDSPRSLAKAALRDL